MSGRLLAIEWRRSVAAWLLPVLLVLAWYLARYARPIDFVSWAATSVRVRDAILFAGPGIGAAAAWMAGRERRRGLDDLLATTALPAGLRHLAAWAGTTAWALLAYLLGGGYILVLASRHAVWGAPTAWPMLIGLLALPAHAALGFAVGWWLPSRFAAPLVALALFFAQAFVGAGVFSSTQYPPNSRFDWVAFLSPMARLDASVWYGVRPHVGPGQALFLLGLTGAALATTVVRGRGRGAARIVFLVALCLALAGAALIVRLTPPGGTLALETARHVRTDIAPEGLIPYEPACSADPLPVCVHPAYRAQRDEHAALINRLAAPLLGLPGMPERAEQRPYGSVAAIDGVLLFPPSWQDVARDPTFAGVVAMTLVQERQPGGRRAAECGGEHSGLACFAAQEAIAIWLVRQAGATTLFFDRHDARGDLQGQSQQSVAAAQRFAALSPEQRRAWLEAHFADLRAGRLPLEALP